MLEGIKACIPSCGDVFPDYIYRLEGTCIKEIPKELVFCDGYDCNYCSDSCLTCSGLLDDNCIICKEGFFFSSNTCILDCGLLKYDRLNW